MQKTLIAAALVTGLVAPAMASDTGAAAPTAPRLSLAEVAQRVEAQGYTIREIEAKGDRYAVEATNRAGQKVKADIDASSGEPKGDWRRD